MRVEGGGRLGVEGEGRLGGWGDSALAPSRVAIECRIYAEDPYNRFLPSTGRIELLQQPGGPGVRVESACYPGMWVGLHYDPLLAKVVAWGATREEAIARMRRALQEFVVLGVKTTIPFHRFAMEDEGFWQGRYDTHFVEHWFEATPEREDLLPIAAAAGALLAARRARSTPTLLRGPNGGSRWGTAARRGAAGWR